MRLGSIRYAFLWKARMGGNSKSELCNRDDRHGFFPQECC